MSLVTNEVLQALLTKLKGKFDDKVDKVSGKGLSTNDFTTEEKNKLAGIAAGATKVTVDSALSSSSTNPVQNKVVNSALAGKLAASQKGAAGGVAELDSSGKVPAAQLPSYVDDVLEGYLYGGKFYKESAHTTEIAGESGKIYVDLSTSKTYRWSGTAFAEISASLALGETSSTAYRGDRGKIAYDHSQAAHAPANAEANVQSDWSVSDTSSDAYIKNKPTSMPANGGNAATVGGHTVGVDVPANAKFTDTTYSAFKGATSGAAGAAGLVPAPAAGDQNKVLGADGTWKNQTSYTHPAYTPRTSGLYKITVDATGHVSAVTAVTKTDITNLGIPGQDTNTTYSNMKGATSSAAGAAGLVPAPAAGATTRFLRVDGTWVTPPNTTYSVATQSANGLMSAADKKKLDGMTEMTPTELDELFEEIFA